MGDHITNRGPALLFGYGLILLLFLTIFSTIQDLSYIPATQRNDMPITDISNIKEGQYVKIDGYIHSNGSIPIQGYIEETAHGSLLLDPQTLAIMNISDSSGSVEVNLLAHPKVYAGPSTSLDSKNKTISEYRDNDRVSVIGTVVTRFDGQSIIHAEYIAKDSRSFGISLEIPYSIFAIIIGLIPTTIGYWLNYKRLMQYHLSEYEQKTPDTRQSVIGGSPFVPQTNNTITWVNNNQRARFLDLAKYLAIISSVTIIMVIILFTFIGFNSQSFLTWILVFFIFLPLTGTIVIAGHQSWVPTRIGFSETGIYAEYAKPQTHKDLLTYIRWSDILNVSYPIAPFGRNGKDILTNGRRLKFEIHPSATIYLIEINEFLSLEILRRYNIIRQNAVNYMK